MNNIKKSITRYTYNEVTSYTYNEVTSVTKLEEKKSVSLDKSVEDIAPAKNLAVSMKIINWCKLIEIYIRLRHFLQ